MMVQEQHPTLQDLINRTGMFDRDIAKNANVSEGTLRAMKQGKHVKAKMIWRVLHFLNHELGTNYDIKDIEGLSY